MKFARQPDVPQMPSTTQKFLHELRRRGLVATLALYVVGAWVVLQAAALAFPGLDVPDAAIRYVWIGAVALFPVAILFGWCFQLTSGGLRRHTAGEDAPLRSGDYWVVSTLAVVSLVIVFAVVRVVLDTRMPAGSVAPVAEAPEHSIAVLPFANMTEDDDNEYFSDGISEQLLNELARIPGLHVAARTSAFYYKGRNEIIQDVGRELGVRHVLEGSVRRSGDRLAITAQLIDAANGYHLWSEVYEREVDDVLVIQDEIARSIADTLKVRMLAAERIPHSDLGPRGAEAYDLFLRGLAIQQAPGPERYDKALEFYRRAVALSPDFTAAHNEIAYCYLMKPYSGEMSFADAIEAAEPYIQRALELEPDSADVVATQALSRSMSRDFQESDRLFQKAVRLNPNYFEARLHYGLSLVYQGRLKEASTAYLHAQSLDPMNATLNANLGALLMLMGRLDDGLSFTEKALSIEPGKSSTLQMVVHWLSEYGRLAEAVQRGRALLRETPGNAGVRSTLVRAYVRLEMIDEAATHLEEIWQMSPDIGRNAWASDYYYMATNDAAGYMEFADRVFQLVDASPGEDLSSFEKSYVFWYGKALLLQRRDQEAADIFSWALGGDEGIARITYDGIGYLKYLAKAYRRIGRDDEARELLEHARELVLTARDNGWSTPVLFVRLAEIEALLGEIDSALQNLNTAIDKGFRDLPWLRYNVFFEDLQEHAEMRRLQSVVRAEVEAERAELEALAAQ